MNADGSDIALLLNRRGGAGPTAARTATTEDAAELYFATGRSKDFNYGSSAII